MTGAILRFGKMNYNGGEVTVSESRRMQKWFNTSAFSPIAANTSVIRSNPTQFDNLTGSEILHAGRHSLERPSESRRGSKPN